MWNDNIPEEKRQYYANRALWRAKILQHVLDLKSKSTKPEELHAKDRAKALFRKSNKAFIAVCALADYDPDWLLKKIEEAKARGFTWKEEFDSDYVAFLGRYSSKNYERKVLGITVPPTPALHALDETVIKEISTCIWEEGNE